MSRENEVGNKNFAFKKYSSFKFLPSWYCYQFFNKYEAHLKSSAHRLHFINAFLVIWEFLDAISAD